MRRHMGNNEGAANAAGGGAAPAAHGEIVPPPMPAHLAQPFPYIPGRPDMGMYPVGGVPPPPHHHPPHYQGHMMGPPGMMGPLHVDPMANNLMHPFLLQPVRGAYNEEYLRIIEQRRTVENNRGASKNCIERNTFPHKFKKVMRRKSTEGDDEEDVEKCTICLCGKFSAQLGRFEFTFYTGLGSKISPFRQLLIVFCSFAEAF